MRLRHRPMQPEDVKSCVALLAGHLRGSACYGNFMDKLPEAWIYFRLAEQRLLLAALRGLTDSELSDELTISVSAVKKTWLSIYERAAKVMSSEFPENENNHVNSKRGKEKKQRLLAYLRAAWKN